MKMNPLMNKPSAGTFADPILRQNWQAHLQAYGPILEPAFREDEQARLLLCAALNLITGKNLPQALLKLKALEKRMRTDADKAACFFAGGLFQEYAGNYEQMAQLYEQANRLGHRFYLPYLKAAKFQLDSRSYGEAEKNYRAALTCLTGTGQRERQLLASSHVNLASCLLMMHRREEAEAALEASRQIDAQVPGRCAVEAVLHALRGEQAQAAAGLEALKVRVPAAYDAIAKSVEQIALGTEPQFFVLEVAEENLQRFWSWLRSDTKVLKRKMDRQDYEPVIRQIAQKLLEAFPFLEQPPYVALGKNHRGYVIQLRDQYALAAAHGYEKLMAACPEDIRASWQFDVVQG